MRIEGSPLARLIQTIQSSMSILARDGATQDELNSVAQIIDGLECPYRQRH